MNDLDVASTGHRSCDSVIMNPSFAGLTRLTFKQTRLYGMPPDLPPECEPPTLTINTVAPIVELRHYPLAHDPTHFTYTD
eukprot:scaffold495572_cov36-Prasinocladus_malaysianus.AAC.1